MKIENVGVWSVGMYLPPEVRGNDWWPESIVNAWREKTAKRRAPGTDANDGQLPPGADLVMNEVVKLATDPFAGSKQRHVMPKGMKSSDMEVAAAKEAMDRAGVKPEEIDLLLVFSQLPDFITIPNCALVHQRLGLPARCFTLTTEAACNSALMQMTLAEQMIKSGSVRRALVVQSSAMLHACRVEDSFSPWFGDGASAMVLGPVEEGFGIMGTCHQTDGTFHRALVTGTPGKNWWDGDGVHLYAADMKENVRMLRSLPALARSAVSGALGAAELVPEQIDFYASHQGTVWFRRLTQQFASLDRARSADTWNQTASLSASNVPFMLGTGEREGMLRNGQLVAMHSGGGGIMWSGMVLRWGRG